METKSIIAALNVQMCVPTLILKCSNTTDDLLGINVLYSFQADFTNTIEALTQVNARNPRPPEG